MVMKVKSDLMSCSTLEGYVSPEVKTLVFQSEGVLCQSLTGSGHGGFDQVGDDYEI